MAREELRDAASSSPDASAELLAALRAIGLTETAFVCLAFALALLGDELAVPGLGSVRKSFLASPLAAAIDLAPGMSADTRAVLRAWLGLDVPTASWGQRTVVALRTLWRFVPFAVIVAAYVGGSIWAPATAHADYFIAAAGALPVLFLALTVESRFLTFRGQLQPARPLSTFARSVIEVVENGGRKPRPGHAAALRALYQARSWVRANVVFRYLAMLIVLILVMLITSEWDCLNALAGIGDGVRNPAQVSAGTLAGLVGGAVVALVGPGRRGQA